MSEPADIASIASRFATGASVVGATPFQAGHINDSYVVACRRDGCPVRFLLQRINHAVFRDPVRVVENIRRVTEHLRGSLARCNLIDIQRRVLTLVPGTEGTGVVRDPSGHFWRMYEFVEGTHTFASAESAMQAYQAARAFGAFQSALADYNGPRLHETIADFHNTPLRVAALEEAIRANRHGRVESARGEIEFALSHRWLASGLLALHAAGAIPERIVHNDAKISNVLFDAESGEALCVVDLDTVMPGLSLYDFGDMVRSMTSRRAEDEPDLTTVEVRVPFFEAIARGYVESVGGFLSAAERANLVTAGKAITFEQGVRFLTDYLEGDVYYRTSRPEHNLDRCRAQFKLLASLTDHEAELNRIVANL